jgi:Major Facilitator Superfamily
MSLLEAHGGHGHELVTMLVVARLVSYTVFSYTGGILADTRDRKQIMLVLDLLGVIVALLYLRSSSSTAMLFLCAIIQSALAGLYEPSRAAILPLLVPPEYLEKANEISCVLWAVAAAAGSTVGGFVIARYGVTVCFVADSLLYLLSAAILATKLKGDYLVKEEVNPGAMHGTPARTSLQQVGDFFRRSEGASYLLLKCSGALLYGAADVLNVTFAQSEGSMDSRRLGWLFTAIGIGNLVGPLVTPEGRCYRIFCVISFLLMGIGYGAIGWFDEFWLKCVWTVVKAAGSAILWVDSTILLQTCTPDIMLGRISAVDFALSTLGEASSAIIAGVLQDEGVAADHVAYILGGLGVVFTAMWASMFFAPRMLQTKLEEQEAIELEPLHEAVVV